LCIPSGYTFDNYLSPNIFNTMYSLFIHYISLMIYDVSENSLIKLF
jgi:hypothetical protein